MRGDEYEIQIRSGGHFPPAPLSLCDDRERASPHPPMCVDDFPLDDRLQPTDYRLRDCGIGWSGVADTANSKKRPRADAELFCLDEPARTIQRTLILRRPA